MTSSLSLCRLRTSDLTSYFSLFEFIYQRSRRHFRLLFLFFFFFSFTSQTHSRVHTHIYNKMLTTSHCFLFNKRLSFFLLPLLFLSISSIFSPSLLLFKKLKKTKPKPTTKSPVLFRS